MSIQFPDVPSKSIWIASPLPFWSIKRPVCAASCVILNAVAPVAEAWSFLIQARFLVHVSDEPE